MLSVSQVERLGLSLFKSILHTLPSSWLLFRKCLEREPFPFPHQPPPLIWLALSLPLIQLYSRPFPHYFIEMVLRSPAVNLLLDKSYSMHSCSFSKYICLTFSLLPIISILFTALFLYFFSNIYSLLVQQLTLQPDPQL